MEMSSSPIVDSHLRQSPADNNKHISIILYSITTITIPAFCDSTSLIMKRTDHCPLIINKMKSIVFYVKFLRLLFSIDLRMTLAHLKVLFCFLI